MLVDSIPTPENGANTTAESGLVCVSRFRRVSFSPNGSFALALKSFPQVNVRGLVA
jgi:hypothetical protein